MLHQMDRKWWDPDNKVFDFDNEDMIKVLKLLVQTPVEMGIEADMGDTQTNLAQQQKVAIARGNIALIFFLKEIDLWYECFTPPDADPTKPSKWMGEGGWGFITLPNVKNQDTAIEFLKWLATYDGQMAWMLNFVSVYMTPQPFRKCNEHEMWNDTGDKYLDNIRHMYKSQFPLLDKQTFFGGMYGYIGQVEGAAAEVCAAIRQKKMTAEEGAKLMQERAVNQYEQWKKDNELA
jgi:ABC-type glycerol-3-phosphate transport system substrate-binding protein